MTSNKLCKITPSLAIEVFKMTYDFEYFRDVSQRAISAGWPDAAKDSVEFMTMMAFVHDSFDILKVKDAVKDWTGKEISDFITWFDDVFGQGDLVNHYVVVQEFFEILAARWFKLHEAEKELADAAIGVSRRLQWFIKNQDH